MYSLGQAPGSATLAVHADWSVDARKRWMAVASLHPTGTALAAPEPVGDPATLLARLRLRAGGGGVALGVDLPLGLPRAYAALHVAQPDFSGFLRSLSPDSAFFQVCAELAEIGPHRPFYPATGRRGMTRLAHAQALGLDIAGFSRACDRATADRPAGAPLFWTLGANQTGKAALAAWRELIIPALHGPTPPGLWPFDGDLRTLLGPGQVAIAETYPAEAMRHIGVSLRGSKRRQADRAACAPALRAAMSRLDVTPTPEMLATLDSGFGPDTAGEDRLDCVLGVLCVLNVLAGHRPDGPPPDPALRRWEGWVLGQHG